MQRNAQKSPMYRQVCTYSAQFVLKIMAFAFLIHGLNGVGGGVVYGYGCLFTIMAIDIIILRSFITALYLCCIPKRKTYAVKPHSFRLNFHT